MADFFQHTPVPTLHHLADHEPDDGVMRAWKGGLEVAVLLPALFSECGRPAFGEILDRLGGVPWVDRVVVSMNGAAAQEVPQARAFVREHLRGKRGDVVWSDDPCLEGVWREAAAGVGVAGLRGKGANVWLGVAWLAAAGHRGWVLAHDSDIRGYRTQLLTRLAVPLMDPHMGYVFSKGYYSRVSDRLYGRVTRLLVFPLLQAMEDVLGGQSMIEHLKAFRYPLAGEFGGAMETLEGLPMEAGWGLEIGLLGELQRRVPVERFCQVDLGFHYEHRHREVDAPVDHEAESGLMKAAGEVAVTLTRQVLRDADPRAADLLKRLIVPRYRERAEEWRVRYEHVSRINGLVVDIASEKRCVSRLATVLEQSVTPGVGSVAGELPAVGVWLAGDGGRRAVLRALETKV